MQTLECMEMDLLKYTVVVIDLNVYKMKNLFKKMA